MTGKSLRDSTLAHALLDVLGDFSKLIQQEIRLAKAEVTEQVADGVRGSVWLMLAGLFAFLGLLTLIEAAVFALWAAGLAPYWGCCAIALALVAASVAAFALGRSRAERGLIPNRSIKQIDKDINVVKEQLS